MDVNGDGNIDANELIESFHIDEDEAMRIIDELDVDDNQLIEFVQRLFPFAFYLFLLLVLKNFEVFSPQKV